MRESIASRVIPTMCVLTLAVSASLGADPEPKRYVLTLEAARELARSGAPALAAARARVDVARAERVGAAVLQPTNPELTFAAGPRRAAGARAGTDVDVEVGQRFELGARRRSRIARADAGVTRAVATAGDAERELLRGVSASFLAALHAERALEAAREGERLLGELRRIAERRFETGDVGILDPHAASLAYAGARLRVARLEAARALAAADLRVRLGLPDDAELALAGDLAKRPRPVLAELVRRAAGRPDLQAIEAGIGEAQADQRLARGFRAPELGAFAGYSREEGAEIVKGGLTIALPFLDRGQGRAATAAAEEQALHLELRAARSAAESEIRSRFEAYAILDAAAARFDAEALPRLEEMLDLGRRSYEGGNTPFAELLVLQREAVETRQAYLDLLLEAALAGSELEAAAGAL